jgi:hypothetical protein
MEGLHQINLGEDPAAIHVGGEVHQVGQGVPVQDGDGIEAAVVAAWPLGAVLLWHHVQRRRPLRHAALFLFCFLIYKLRSMPFIIRFYTCRNSNKNDIAPQTCLSKNHFFGKEGYKRSFA